MATARNLDRPLSPHLQIWKWGPHMLVSILHRACGTAMATAGTVLFVWWLAAAASGREAYDAFLQVASFWYLGYVVAVGLTLAFFLHLANGIRHFFMDAGANFELRANKSSAVAVILFGLGATAAYWAYLIWAK